MGFQKQKSETKIIFLIVLLSGDTTSPTGTRAPDRVKYIQSSSERELTVRIKNKTRQASLRTAVAAAAQPATHPLASPFEAQTAHRLNSRQKIR
jgi:ABC-type molybdate transport system substrate-binding protein